MGDDGDRARLAAVLAERGYEIQDRYLNGCVIPWIVKKPVDDGQVVRVGGGRLLVATGVRPGEVLISGHTGGTMQVLCLESGDIDDLIAALQAVRQQERTT